MIAYLMRALLLCGLQETVLSLRGYCAGNVCYALFVESNDYQGAQKSCRDFTGDLLVFKVEEGRRLLAGLSGSFWFGSETVADPQDCISGTHLRGGNLTLHVTPCGDELDGYVCQYPVVDPCRTISVAADALVRYSAPMGFEVNATSLHFPSGTLALAWNTDTLHPDTKHLCFESNWLQAPWNCEVMDGGCAHKCDSTSGSCVCPPEREYLHANLFSCSDDPCARCAHLCDNATQTCECHVGYKLAQDGKSCADVDECQHMDACTGVGEECVNTRGEYECRCKDGFVEETGECVDVSVCDKCEHMKCVKSDGVYACACRDGFRVSPRDPTKCEMYCDQQDCPANCITNPDVKEKDMHQCFCPDGYIQDIRNNTAYCTDINECEILTQCDHTCENQFGSFACSCDEGYKLFDEYMCVHPEEDEWTPVFPTAAQPRPAAVPSYVKAGSVLGITVFLLLCLVLLYLLVRNLTKRCGSLDLASIKGPDMDIFYLQQVTTETYKRLSFDRQSICDSQRL
ncbi:thrombomodulin-like [Vanacampus margaritifer]